MAHVARTSHTHTLRSSPPVARYLLSCEKLTHVTHPACPNNTRVGCLVCACWGSVLVSTCVVYVCMYVCIYSSFRVCYRLCLCVCVYIYISTVIIRVGCFVCGDDGMMFCAGLGLSCLCMCAYIFPCVYVKGYVCVCIYIYIYIYLCVCMYVCIQDHTCGLLCM